jgi:hypothetical protein
VLKLIDGDVNLTMGYIYEALERAKEEVGINFNNKLVKYDFFMLLIKDGLYNSIVPYILQHII